MRRASHLTRPVPRPPKPLAGRRRLGPCRRNRPSWSRRSRRRSGSPNSASTSSNTTPRSARPIVPSGCSPRYPGFCVARPQPTGLSTTAIAVLLHGEAHDAPATSRRRRRPPPIGPLPGSHRHPRRPPTQPRHLRHQASRGSGLRPIAHRTERRQARAPVGHHHADVGRLRAGLGRGPTHRSGRATPPPGSGPLRHPAAPPHPPRARLDEARPAHHRQGPGLVPRPSEPGRARRQHRRQVLPAAALTYAPTSTPTPNPERTATSSPATRAARSHPTSSKMPGPRPAPRSAYRTSTCTTCATSLAPSPPAPAPAPRSSCTASATPATKPPSVTSTPPTSATERSPMRSTA